MATLDVFNDNAFSMIELTESTKLLPSIPGYLGSRRLFQSKGVTTTTVMIEEEHGKISLLPTDDRGATPTGSTDSRRTRKARSLTVPHIPVWDTILAEEVQNVRAFGSESEMEAVADVVNEKIQTHKQDFEATWEYHRMGAVSGKVLDADGSTVLLDLFSTFGLTEHSIDIEFNTESVSTGDDVKTKCREIKRYMELKLGGQNFTGILALCSSDYFDYLLQDPIVKAAYDRYQNGQVHRDQQGGSPNTGGGDGFMYGGIEFVEYAPQIGSVKFIPDGDARYIPLETNIFQERYAPADFMDTVNTRGIPLYTSQEMMKHKKGIELHMQSNPLFFCTRPQCLVQSTGTQAT